jgi:hypothetical protein
VKNQKGNSALGGCLTVVVIVGVLGGVLAMCSGGGDDTPPRPTATYAAPSATYTAPATPSLPVTTDEMPDAVLVALTRSNVPVYADDTADSIISLAHTICTSFSNGMSRDTILGVIMGVGATVGEASYFMGLSTAAYCPSRNLP